jgi:peptidoglycan/LPS O-acetylase OafA/YrhL
MDRNRFIDCWRGISVSLVVIGHLIGSRYQHQFEAEPFRNLLAGASIAYSDLVKNIALRILAPLPGLGVDIFFIISGFLITKLMMREQSERGTVSLSAFYVRRVCRIIPAFYVYLITVFMMSYYDMVYVPGESFLWNGAFLWSGAFLCDTGVSCTWFLGHTWSLGVEEQFYLIWPLLFILLGRLKEAWLIAVFVSLLIISFAFPLALSFAHIAIGGLFALSPSVNRIIMRLAKSRFISLATIVIFFQPFLASFSVMYGIVNAARPLMLAAIFFGTIAGVGPFTRLVSSFWLQRLGVVSYSVYLWQQLSTARAEMYRDNTILYIPILFIVPALLSYFFLEKPIIKIGHRLSNVIKKERPSIAIKPAQELA